MKEILEHRGTYIAAALTICRAYRAAGQPGLLPQLDSYGDWSDTVGPRWCGWSRRTR